jgi:cell division septation protein DedD
MWVFQDLFLFAPARFNMSRKQSSDASGSTFKRLLGWTLLLALVFSAGLITGERLVRKKSLEPLISVTDQVAGSAADADAESAGDEPTTFAFFDKLTRKGEVALATSTKAEPAAEKAEEKVAPRKPSSEEASSEKPEPKEAAQQKAAPQKAEVDVEEANGEKPEVRKPEPIKPAAARYTLQVAAHPDLDGAKKHMERLQKMGLQPFVVSAAIPGKGKFFRVRVGKFSSMEEARAFQASLKAKNSLNTFVSPL